MGELQYDMQVIVDELKTQRDILLLKMHLAKKEAKDEWEELEKKWQYFASRSEQVTEEVQDTAEDVLEDLKDLGEDLQEGYSRIKKLLS